MNARCPTILDGTLGVCRAAVLFVYLRFFGGVHKWIVSI